MSDANLVTACNFNGREYFVKMNTTNNILELIVTDKMTGEDWQCCYDASYIEGITQKTGNFKQFDIFITMLKSGLLKTSHCIYLDLMTFEDLDALRHNKIRGPYSSYHMTHVNHNRRYLIITYTVEFDRIHYPLPLEYCGPPDPQVLQQHIVRLEDEVVRLKEQLKYTGKSKTDTKLIMNLEERIEDLTNENLQLRTEMKRMAYLLECQPKDKLVKLQTAIKNLEKCVQSERRAHHQVVQKLRQDKDQLMNELERVKSSCKTFVTRDRLHKRVSDPGIANIKYRSPSPKTFKSETWQVLHPEEPKRLSRRRTRRRSRSDSETSGQRYSSPKAEPMVRRTNVQKNVKLKSPASSRSPSASSRTSSSSAVHSKKHSTQTSGRFRPKPKQSELDFTSLESKIQAMQRLLHSDFN